jgi:RimJ/RimL family protein N-acetyltransferase
MRFISAMYHGEMVRLRALEMEDLDSILEHWNNLELRRHLATQLPVSMQAERQWLERCTLMNPFRDNRIILAIEDKESSKLIGTVGLEDISKQHSSAEFGIAIYQESYRGRGYGTDATRVMLWVAFNVLGLNSVQLTTNAENKRAQRAYEKAGFKPAGRYREKAFVLGHFQDLIIMDCLKKEFFEQYPPGKQIGEP